MQCIGHIGADGAVGYWSQGNSHALDKGGGHRHIALRHGELVVGHCDVRAAGFDRPGREAVTCFRGSGQRHRGTGVSL